jgi:hypothetical protein
MAAHGEHLCVPVQVDLVLGCRLGAPGHPEQFGGDATQ